MKNILLGTVALMALAAPASAADLAARPYTKAPPPIVSVYDWGGFYIGANGGWGSSHKCWDFALPGVSVLAEGCHDATGGVSDRLSLAVRHLGVRPRSAGRLG